MERRFDARAAMRESAWRARDGKTINAATIKPRARFEKQGERTNRFMRLNRFFSY
jgi:hypothetical protein